MLTAIFFYAMASICVFFQHNIQFMYPAFKDKSIYLVFVLSIPTGLFYLKAWTYFVQSFGSVWTARFMFFGLSYLIFPILAYFFLNETPLTFKTFICTILSVLIIIIQYKM